MPNACFRCKTPIDSGGTFCRDCRGKVSLDLQYTRESRLWLVVAALPVWLLVSLVVVPAASVVAPARVTQLLSVAVTFVTLPLLFAFVWALLKDAEHVRARDDADWNPSKWGYWALAFVCVFGVFLPVPFVAGYHLYRRYTTVGLPLGRD